MKQISEEKKKKTAKKKKKELMKTGVLAELNDGQELSLCVSYF